MGKLDKLQPAAVWKIFEAMNQVPRGSGNEAGVMNMLKGWADERGLAWKQDEVGNLLISIPATKGLEKAKPVLVQGHVDMVCEKNSDVEHDFMTQGIEVEVDGVFLNRICASIHFSFTINSLQHYNSPVLQESYCILTLQQTWGLTT